jgi:hypothetical protein
LQKAFYLDACWIGETMGMSMEEWPKETKIKVILSIAVIFAAAIFFSLI